MRYSTLLILMYLSLSADIYVNAVPVSQPQDTLNIQKFLDLVDEFIFNDPDLAREYAQQALSFSRETGNKEGKIQALFVLGELHIRNANRTEAISYIEEGLQNALSAGNRQLTGVGYYNLSRYYEISSEYTDALDYIRQALEIFQELELESNIANSNNSLGRIYQQLGDFSSSLDYLFEALRINEKLERRRGMSVSYTNIGNTFLRNGRYDEAIRYFSEALALDVEMEDPTGIMVSKLNLGAAWQRNEDYETAMIYHEEALVLARELGYREDEAIILGNIGSTYRKLGHTDGGLLNLFEALAIMRETGYNTTATLNNISEAYLDLNDFEKVIEYSYQAERTGMERSDLDRLQFTYRNLAAAYEGLGDFERANQALKLYNTTKDNLFTIEREKQINQLQILYDIEKRDQTIDLLTLEAETASLRRNTYLASGMLVSLILLLLYSGQRTKTRKNRQLLEKSKEVARMKSSFFSNISHEFRTPLTLISGPIEKLRSGIDDPGLKKELNIMEKNSDRLLFLINQLLDLSQLESGSLTLSVEKSDLISIVKGITMSFQSLAELREIQLSVNAESDFYEGWTDSGKLETILINLIGNAMKFTKDGGEVCVKIVETNDTNGLKRCLIHVSDNGEGISQRDLDHIFDRFYRGSETGLPGSAGSGIGLALTKELVQLHKGTITVQSTTRAGTEFIVNLPISRQHYNDHEIVHPSAAAISSYPASTETGIESYPDPVIAADDSAPLLLLIEDNRDVMNYLIGILEGTYRILKAPDGEAGVAVALEQIPDLIISDVMMPKMGGYRVAEILKQDKKTSHIPLILLTAKASHEDRVQGLQTHADDYITKPFRPDELLLRIQNLILSRKKMREKYNQKIEIRPEDLSAQSMEESFLLLVVETIKNHLVDENFTVDKLAREVGMSRSQLHRKLVALTDQSATEFIRSYRLNLAKEMIEKQAGTISEIAYKVGFNSLSYFSKTFREKFGVNPSEFE